MPPTIPRNPVAQSNLQERSLTRLETLRQAVSQAKKAMLEPASEDDLEDTVNPEISRRTTFRVAACGLAYANGLGAVVEALPQAAAVVFEVAPQVRLLQTLYESRSPITHFLSRLLPILKSAIVEPSASHITIDNAVYHYGEAIEGLVGYCDHSRFKPYSQEELNSLWNFFKPPPAQNYEAVKKANMKILIQDPFFKRELDKYIAMYQSWGDSPKAAKERARDTMYSLVRSITSDRVVAAQYYKSIVKILEQKAPNSYALRTFKRLWQEGPWFVKDDPWFKSKVKEEKIKARREKEFIERVKKEETTNYKQELYEKFNYQVLLRLYNPEIDEYDQFVFS